MVSTQKGGMEYVFVLVKESERVKMKNSIRERRQRNRQSGRKGKK